MACLAAPLVLCVPAFKDSGFVAVCTVATDAARLDAPMKEIGDIDAWRSSMPGCSVGWLASWLVGLAGWLAGWLADCSWRVAVGWLLAG